MRVPLVLPVAFVSCLVAAGCGTTVTLKNGSRAPQSQARAVSAAPAASSAPAAVAPATPPAVSPLGPPNPMTANIAPASGMFGPARPAGGLPADSAMARGAGGKRRATMGDRMASGMQTGSVGAFFGGLAGPIGFAAGGGSGFLIGFISGQSPFGPVADEVDGDSWENQVESQRQWEAQVHDQLARLDAQGQGATAVPVTDVAAPAGSADPMGDYQAWSRQVTAHARPAGGDASGRVQAIDRNGDGRPDREDLYTKGRLTTRRLDNDGDGRYETIETIEGDVIASWMMDLDGDGRFECRSIRDAEGVHHVERDADGDGRTDAWIMMIGEGAGAAVREQVDTDGDGKPDSTTIYMDGHVVKEQNVATKKAGTGS